MRRVMGILFFLVFCFGMTNTVMAAAPCYVSTEVKGKNIFKTIQKAIDATYTKKDGTENYVCYNIIVSDTVAAGATIDRSKPPINDVTANLLKISGGNASKTLINKGIEFKLSTTGRAGFYIARDKVLIENFEFKGAPDKNNNAIGNIRFPIYSEGSNNVTIQYNLMKNSVQGISNWNGSGWVIAENQIYDLVIKDGGGGIGIVVGGYKGTNYTVTNNSVSGNTITGWGCIDAVGDNFSGSGVALFVDYLRPNDITHPDNLGAIVTGNTVNGNPITLYFNKGSGPDQRNIGLNGVSLTVAYTEGKGIYSPDELLYSNSHLNNNIDISADMGFVRFAYNPLSLEDVNVLPNDFETTSSTLEGNSNGFSLPVRPF